MVRPIRACIFDMDGLLLNTEDLITECIDAILLKHNKGRLPWSIQARIQGRSAKESNAILLEWAQLPISEDEYVKQLKQLHDRVFPTAEPLPGVQRLLAELKTKDSVAIALATSSTLEKFAVKTQRHASLFQCFPKECIVLGDDARVTKHKPAPDIYFCALQGVNEKLNKGPNIMAGQCLVFEDSIQGVDAGRRAGMAVVWCPHPMLLQELLKGSTEDVHTNFCTVFGLVDVDVRHMSIQLLANLIDETSNGWIRLVPTLEDFDLDEYGL